MQQKAQVSVEYLTIVSVLLIVIGVFFGYSMFTYNQSSQNYSIKTAVDSLAQAANQVHALGPGNVRIVKLTLPEGIDSVSVTQRTIVYELQSQGGINQAWAITNADLNGSLPTTSGLHIIKVEAINGTVQFTEQ